MEVSNTSVSVRKALDLQCLKLRVDLLLRKVRSHSPLCLIVGWERKFAQKMASITSAKVSHLFPLVYLFINFFFIQVLECNNIVQAMNILEGLIPGEDAPKQVDASHLEKLFVFSLMWSVGALLELEDRKKVTESNEFKWFSITLSPIYNFRMIYLLDKCFNTAEL